MNPSPRQRLAASELRTQRARFLAVALALCVSLLALQAIGSPHAPVRVTGGAAAVTFSLLLLVWRRGLISQQAVGAVAGAVATALMVVRMVSVLVMMEATGADARVTAIAIAVQTFVIPALLAGVVLDTRPMLAIHTTVGAVVVVLAVVVPGREAWTAEPESVGGVIQMLVLMGLISAMTHVLNASTLSMEESEGRARIDAETDPLTGLANRRSLERALRTIVEEGRSGGVLMIDLDHFKAVNDTLGHEAGDDALVEVAATLDHVVRPDDVVGRWGGEEFLVVLTDVDVSPLIEVAERIRTAVATLDGVVPGGVTVSIGAALLRSGDDSERLVGRADRALYVAKDAGRNRVATADRLSDGGDRPTVV